MAAKLTISAPAEAQKWTLNPTDADRIAGWIREPVTIEYWPRDRIGEAWSRDSGADSHAAERENLNFRGYSYSQPGVGNVAVIFVDSMETYESATFVVLHELAHLHLPPWSPAAAKDAAEEDREEERADAVAARLMSELLGYEGKVYEARGPGGRALNPPMPCCPRAGNLFR